MNNYKYIAFCLALWGNSVWQFISSNDILIELGSLFLALIVTFFALLKMRLEYIRRKVNDELDRQIKEKELEHINHKVVQDRLETKAKFKNLNN